jgi:hypothetical protein
MGQDSSLLFSWTLSSCWPYVMGRHCVVCAVAIWSIKMTFDKLRLIRGNMICVSKLLYWTRATLGSIYYLKHSWNYPPPMETEVTLLFHKNPLLLLILSQINPYHIYNDVVDQQIKPDRICFNIYWNLSYWALLFLWERYPYHLLVYAYLFQVGIFTLDYPTNIYVSLSHAWYIPRHIYPY